MKHFLLFNDHTEYDNYKNSHSIPEPSISICRSEDDIHYKPEPDYTKEYFTIESLEDNNIITLKAKTAAASKTFEISTDNGLTWTPKTTTTNGVQLATLNTGKKLLIKGINTYNTLADYNIFDSTKKFDIKGNIMSLFEGDNFQNITTFSTQGGLCYLFRNCKTLIHADKLVLNCTSIPTNGCHAMFDGCSNLKTPPQLPALTIGSSGYGYMFYACISLITAPELPATTLIGNCYNHMFYQCSRLKKAPKLLNLNLSTSCYESMFANCTSLIEAPELPATTLKNACYRNMFYRCKSLEHITCLATDISATNCTNNWVVGVSSSGIFIKDPNTTWSSGFSGIPTGWGSVIEFNPTINLSNNLCITAISTKNISYIGLYKLSAYQTIYISKDNYNWMSLPYTTPISFIEINENEELYIYGILTSDNTQSQYTEFCMIGSITLSGNINYLFNENNQINEYAGYRLFRDCQGLISVKNLEFPNSNLSSNCYEMMFYNCTNLTMGPNKLPATTLANYCYSNMFYQCGITIGPELPATTLKNRCYTGMFDSCPNLIIAPELPATTLASYCYASMFYGCISLITAPELPATTLVNNCYESMFSECISLTTAPELPAITLARYCYHEMFSNCVNLVNIPSILPATTLASYCYSDMFYYCSNLTTAPELPAQTLVEGCYFYMFHECNSLNYIKCLAVNNISIDTCEEWVTYVSDEGTFIGDPNSTWTNGNNGVPEGWETNVQINNYHSNNTLRIWVDDFPDRSDIAGEWGYSSWSDFVYNELRGVVESDLEAMGTNPYEYTGKTFIWDGDEYYIWVKPDEFDDMDYGGNVKYLLTDTIDYDTLYHRSIVYNSDNCGGIVCFLSSDLSTYEIVDDQYDWSDSIITVVEL